ncbi:ketoacyl-ACP synthase III [Alphaproteobacteria bacterium]|nr:ketoacyl-ACP synthase III [Alphaproteobacteria bacterium]
MGACTQFLTTGAALPERRLTNDALAKTVETSDEWIRTRTGIGQRYFAAPGELTSDLAVRAARQALARANLAGSDVDLIILATTTPDETFPATATKVQHQLGSKGLAFDVQAVCSGYLLALKLADQALRLGQANRALIIGAETLSHILDMKDRRTCVLFGDGAGAVLMERVPGETDPTNSAVIACEMESDGAYHDILRTTGGVGLTQEAGVITMVGQDVFRQAVTKLAQSAAQLLEKTNISAEAVDWFIPHQANQRIIDATCQKMKIPDRKVISTVKSHANTSAASIPLALNDAVQTGKVRPGDLILHQAIGAGLVWGSALVRWGKAS